MISFKEYYENGTDPALLVGNFTSKDDFITAHKNSVIVCHDVYIRYKNDTSSGILLVKRKNKPALGVLWPIGGRIMRGVTFNESLKKKAKDECGLDIHSITVIGVGRTLFKDNAQGHEKGVDTMNLICLAEASGEITLNKDHEEPILVTKESYKSLRPSLEAYVRDHLDYIDSVDKW